MAETMVLQRTYEGLKGHEMQYEVQRPYVQDLRENHLDETNVLFYSDYWATYGSDGKPIRCFCITGIVMDRDGNETIHYNHFLYKGKAGMLLVCFFS
jgi:hypothetical protein